MTYEMTPEQKQHSLQNTLDFSMMYEKKYANGQKEHGGNMWEMGAYQALNNAEEEVLDMWSYIRQFRKCLDEINGVIKSLREDDMSMEIKEIRSILNRVKKDD